MSKPVDGGRAPAHTPPFRDTASRHRLAATSSPTWAARHRGRQRPGSARWLAVLAVATVGALVVTLTPTDDAAIIATAATTVVTNASLETDANGDKVPDCWQSQGSGSSKSTFTWSTAGHSGSHAEQVSLTRYRSGSRGLFIAMGSSGCGPTLATGHSYALTAWYQTAGSAGISVYYRNLSGTWVPWVSGRTLPPASSWTQASYLTPAVPSDATAVSFGVELRSGGTLTTDDYALADVGTSTPTASPTSSPSPTATASPTSSPSPTATASPTSSPSPTATATASPTSSPSPTATASPTGSSAPPPSGGYFPSLVAPGNVTALPSGAACATAVHRSTWEPRPDNYGPNHTLVDPTAVHQSFAARKKSVDGTHDPRWDSWLLPRVDGQFTGTTDEIIQWAACKWGLPDNYLRAEAEVESTWYQNETYPSGRCVYQYGCGDWFGSEPYAARKTYCDGIAASGGYDYQKDFGDGLCPKTFSIVGVMSWWNPAWGYNWTDNNQDGTFPFTRNSTAMALDFMASQIRGCYEGWESWLGSGYAPGDLMGCAGAWYSGAWHDADADAYIGQVQTDLDTRPWLSADWISWKPKCDPTYGCPGPATLQ